MIAMLLTTALLVFAGLPLALALPARERTAHGILGESFLLGAGAASLVLFALSSAEIEWSRLSFGIGLAIVVVVAAPFAARRRRTWIPLRRPGLANLPDVLTLILAGGHALLATLAPPIENDYLLIWGVKARVFLASAGIDWTYLEAPLNVTSHPDYPLLLPLLYDAHAIVIGAWPGASIGLVTFAFGAAATLAVRGLLAREMSRPARAVTTAILMPLLFSPYIGLAEGPLIAYVTIGVLYVRRGSLDAIRGDVFAGAVFLGLAAWTKNEGLSLIAVAAFALILVRKWRLLVSLWPALLIPLPWLILHRLHGLRVDLAEGGTMDRLVERVSDPLPLLSTLAQRTGMPLLFWSGVILAMSLTARRLITSERFLSAATFVQFAIYAGVYFMTPRELDWHITTSWDRVLRQIMPLVALTALLPTAPVIASLLRRHHATDSRTDRPPGSAGAA